MSGEPHAGLPTSLPRAFGLQKSDIWQIGALAEAAPPDRNIA